MTMKREMEEAPRSDSADIRWSDEIREAPLVTTALLQASAYLRWWRDGGDGEFS